MVTSDITYVIVVIGVISVIGVIGVIRFCKGPPFLLFIFVEEFFFITLFCD